MQLNQLKREYTNTRSRRIGRGGKRGTTSGRGTKGQRARAGHRIRPAERDIIKKIPKLRGHGKNRARGVNPSRIKPAIVNLARLERYFVAGSEITPNVLLSHGLISRQGGKIPPVKILAVGALTRPLTVSGCLLSKEAQEKIKKAGGLIK